jgi:hypothetical protein
MGKVVAERGHVTQLLGIAPAGKVTYPGGPAEDSIPEGAALDPNHSHFILVDGAEWSSGTEMMFKVADALAAEARVVAVLVNGGAEAKEEVRRCVERSWPIIVIEGSGRLADQLAANLEIVSGGNLSTFPLGGSPAELRQLIVRHAEGALVEAWRRFAQFDSKAKYLQKRHTDLLTWTLTLGVLGTLFVISQKQLMDWAARQDPRYRVLTAFLILALPIILLVAAEGFERFRRSARWVLPGIFLALLVLLVVGGLPNFFTDVLRALGVVILAVPITVSILLTAASYFKPRQKWILLRGSAEAIKKEIFRYRTQVGDYSDEKTEAFASPIESPPATLASRDEVLVDKTATICRRLMRTEVNTVSLGFTGTIPPEYAVKKGDDGFSFLTPDRYIEVRLQDQIDYYLDKGAKLEKKIAILQWTVFIIGGVGTFLAALKWQLWIALTTALVTALTAYATDFQWENTLIKYNQAASDLNDLRSWWRALGPDAKERNKDTLVESSEKILESEQSGWVQQMQDAMASVQAAAEENKKK